MPCPVKQEAEELEGILKRAGVDEYDQLNDSDKEEYNSIADYYYERTSRLS